MLQPSRIASRQLKSGGRGSRACACVCWGGVHGQDRAEMDGVERADSALVRLGAAADAEAGRV